MAEIMLTKILLKEMSQWSGFNGKGHTVQDPVERCHSGQAFMASVIQSKILSK